METTGHVTFEPAQIPPEYGVEVKGVTMNLYGNAAFFYRWVKYGYGHEKAVDLIFPHIRKEWEAAKILNEQPSPRKKNSVIAPDNAVPLY